MSDCTPTEASRKITTVNYHFLRTCPYRCTYCFYPNTNNEYLPLEKACEGIRKLRDAGIRKITFSGGEPFVLQKHLGEMVRFAHEIGFEVSIVTNAALLKESWFDTYGKFVAQLCVSCDSFDNETNIRIGRSKSDHDEGHVDRVYRARMFCTTHGIAFKLNTTVSSANWEEDMAEHVRNLRPSRWKVFQCLPVPGENCGEGAPRNAEDLFITEKQFKAFLERNRDVGEGVARVPETNSQMENSYLIVDQDMRILTNIHGRKVPTQQSILDASFEEVLESARLDHEQFYSRGGDYVIRRPEPVFDW